MSRIKLTRPQLFDVIIKFFKFLAGIIALWCIICNIVNGDSMYLWGNLVLLVIAVLIFFPIKKPSIKFFQSPKVRQGALIAVCVLAILARFSFASLVYRPTSDPKTFFDIAAAVSEHGPAFVTQNDYVATFPFVAPYSWLLGFSMVIFGQNNLAVIALNSICDITAAVILALLLIKLRSRQAGLVAAAIYLANPITVVFASLSLPVSIVNFFIILVALLTYLFVSHKNPSWWFAIVLGLVFSLANAFRPIISILLIAIILALLVFALTKRFTGQRLALKVIVIVGVFLAGNYGFTTLVSSATGQEAAINSGGFSIYMGSNYQKNGAWNPVDAKAFSAVRENSSAPETHAKFQREGIKRYVELGPKYFLRLLIRKSEILVGRIRGIFYNIYSYPAFHYQEKSLELILIASWAGIILLAYFSLRFIWSINNKKPEIFSIILIPTFIGLFFAMLLMESSPRYFTPFIPLLTIFAVLYFYQPSKKVR